MTRLEKIKTWLATYPEFDILGSFQVDYTDRIYMNEGGALPAGFAETERRQDILGNTTVVNQCNFAIYCAVPGPQGKEPDTGWIEPFREWVQAQSAAGAIPALGDPGLGRENAAVGPGMLYRDSGDGTAAYLVTLTIKFKERYEV